MPPPTQLHSLAAFYMDKSCVAHNSRGCTPPGVFALLPPPQPSSTLLLLSYLPAHLGSNSGPLPRTHGQLRSIRRRNSRFHRSDRPIPWHKHEQLHSHSEVTILSQVGRRQTLIIIFYFFTPYPSCLRKPVFFNSVEIFVCFRCKYSNELAMKP